MKIFILRHGQAEPYQTNDAVRRLTEKGITDTQKVLTEKLSALANINAIFASPLVRAQQTATIASTMLKKEIKTTDLLEPEANIQKLFNWLETIKENSILLVSHLPLVGILANDLCGFDGNRIQFYTSSLVGIECDFPASGLGNLFLEVHS